VRVWVALGCLAGCSYDPTEVTAPPIDSAPGIDAFDATRDCPADYTLAFATSRYRVIVDGRKAWEHSDDCTSQRAGATHLAAVDSMAELDAIQNAINAIGSLPNNRAWVGGVQLRSQATPGAGWLSVTGGELVALWDGGEPNDGLNNEDNDENFVGIEVNRTGLVDFPTDDTEGAVCECDGKRLDPAAAAAIDANRQD
jgi:hypothetical protein